MVKARVKRPQRMGVIFQLQEGTHIVLAIKAIHLVYYSRYGNVNVNQITRCGADRES